MCMQCNSRVRSIHCNCHPGSLVLATALTLSVQSNCIFLTIAIMSASTSSTPPMETARKLNHYLLAAELALKQPSNGTGGVALAESSGRLSNVKSLLYSILWEANKEGCFGRRFLRDMVRRPLFLSDRFGNNLRSPNANENVLETLLFFHSAIVLVALGRRSRMEV